LVISNAYFYFGLTHVPMFIQFTQSLDEKTLAVEG